MCIVSVTALRGVGGLVSLGSKWMMCEKNMKYGYNYNLKNSLVRGSGFEPSKRNKIGNGHGGLSSKSSFWLRVSFAMLFLWGVSNRLPPQKVLFHDVVLTRVSIGFLREN